MSRPNQNSKWKSHQQANPDVIVESKSEPIIETKKDDTLPLTKVEPELVIEKTEEIKPIKKLKKETDGINS